MFVCPKVCVPKTPIHVSKNDARGHPHKLFSTHCGGRDRNKCKKTNLCAQKFVCPKAWLATPAGQRLAEKPGHLKIKPGSQHRQAEGLLQLSDLANASLIVSTALRCSRSDRASSFFDFEPLHQHPTYRNWLAQLSILKFVWIWIMQLVRLIDKKAMSEKRDFFHKVYKLRYLKSTKFWILLDMRPESAALNRKSLLCVVFWALIIVCNDGFIKNWPAGNWTRVFRVTGGNTNHYTTTGDAQEILIVWKRRCCASVRLFGHRYALMRRASHVEPCGFRPQEKISR